jgi:hypothetical protein
MVSKVGEDGGVRGSLGGGQGCSFTGERRQISGASTKPTAPSRDARDSRDNIWSYPQKPWNWIHVILIGARMYSAITM